MIDFFLIALKTYATLSKFDFIRKTHTPTPTQATFLQTLLRVQQTTELGQEFRLDEIHTVDQFRQRVPIWPYDAYAPYTDRIAQGEPNVLNPDPVVYINLTSGTTGAQKQVPVTRRFQRSLACANATCVGFLLDGLQQESQRQSRSLALGKILSTNSIRLQGQTSGGIDYGPVTVGSIRNGRLFCAPTFAQPLTAMEVSDSLSRHYVCLLFALRHTGLRGMIANFPMLMLRTCSYLEKFAEDLIRDLATGTIAPWLNLEPEIRQTLEQQWVALPQRAAQLEQAIAAEGRLTPPGAWKHLSFVMTAKGGTSDFYLQRFPHYLKDIPVYGGVYGTAEGTFAIYPGFEASGGILALDSGFYEFIPVDQWEVASPKTLLPHEVAIGEQYRLLVTSYSGFYRYDIGDVVEVTGFYNQTPLIAFRHRRGGLLSATTEKTTEFHVTQVMQRLQHEFDLTLDDFCVTLSDHEFPARYLLNIELAPHQSLPHPDRFLARFDAQLGEVNHPYRTVRAAEVPPPRLRLLAPGSFAIVRLRQLQRGTSDSQLKIPHISEDRQFLDGLQVVGEWSQN